MTARRPDPTAARGFRNRNPGNIVFNRAIAWRGQVGAEPAGRFVVFEDHVWGIRALAVLLRNYQRKHGLSTIRALIRRYAPPVENDTEAYVQAVARRTGFAPDAPLDLGRRAHLRPLVEAVIHHELGGQPYEPALIDRALDLAGVAA
ncbi:hypothetical protein [Rubritepida flocculans]|uniref:hypothetical protein n=1 Tax=Rubritepida flocculans TaxID=182403 RepID=UPI00040ACE42|nr:hypothetical protein [Rubritepida flocculans]